MAEVKLEIPVEHVSWFRKSMKGEMAADANEFPDTNDVDRETAIEGQEKIARYVALLDQLGWEDDGLGGIVSLEEDFARELLNGAVGELKEDMQVATGHYDSTKLNLVDVRRVGSRAVWLAESLNALDAEAVAS